MRKHEPCIRHVHVHVTKSRRPYGSLSPRSQLGLTFDAGQERPNSLANSLRDGIGNLSRITMNEDEGLRVSTMVEPTLTGMELGMPPIGSMSSDGLKPGVRISVDLRFV